LKFAKARSPETTSAKPDAVDSAVALLANAGFSSRIEQQA
jgi:hypothetical protein